MQNQDFRFNRNEFAGSLGDLGTLIPLTVALIVLCDLSITPVFCMIGLFYIASGWYFRLPMPVQPLKVVAAVAIAAPDQVNASILAATSILFGFILLIIAFSGLIDKIAKLFSKPIVRGIQLGLGLILIRKGLGFILQMDLFGLPKILTFDFHHYSTNLMLGVIVFFIALLLISSKRFPAALVIVSIGVIIGFLFGFPGTTNLSLGPTQINLELPSSTDFLIAFTLLVIPQIPLTIGNAIIGTHDTAKSLFGAQTIAARVSNRKISISMGIANLIIGIVGAVPLCHGAGGLAAHYRFGARTGGSNLIIGFIFLIIAFFFGAAGIVVLSALPNAILGVLLLFAGLELAVLIKDLDNKANLYISLLIASVGFISSNMSIAFGIGIIVSLLIQFFKIEI